MNPIAGKHDYRPAPGVTFAASAVAERPRGAQDEVGQGRHGPLAPRLAAAVEAAFHITSDIVLFLTTDLQIVGANAAAVANSGHSFDELQKLSVDDVFPDGDFCRAIRAGLHRLFRHGMDEEAAFASYAKDGALRRVRIKLRLLRDGDHPLLVAAVRDLNDRRRAKSSLARTAHRDHLTGLFNRAALDRRLQRAERLAQRCDSRFALLFIDVDNFKNVNDTLGHRAGDRVLRAVARQLRACVRPGDFVARYGGDEFVVLIEHLVDDAEVDRIQARLRTELFVPVTRAGEHLTITASVGAAVSQGATSALELLDAADQAMYRAKLTRCANMLHQSRRA